MMAIEQPDFSKIFADGATIGELLNMPDEEYLRGWGYLGQNEPPPMEYFNYIYNLQDNKLKYLFISANIRKSNTQYHVDDIVTSPYLQSKFMLVCIQAGTTDSNEPVFDSAEEGQEITDGTVKWRVFSKLASGITVGEEEPVNARDNAVWLALNGVDDIAQLKYQKDGEWKQIFIQSILNAIKDSPIKSLLRNTSYEVNDILADSTCKGAFFICTFAGTTGPSVASGFATAEEGQEITDGTAKFKVHYFKEIISSVNIMSGATSSKGGTAGLVPAPSAGAQNKALFGDGTYKQVVETINGIKPNEDNNITLITGINMLNRKKAYQIGDIAYSQKLPSWAYLSCVTAGTTAADEPSFGDVTAMGKYITDGSVKWIVEDIRFNVPVGVVFYDSYLHAGCVKFNGATVQREDYPNLVAIADAKSLWTSDPTSQPWLYGQGDGSTTMVLPDFRNVFIEGGDTPAKVEAGAPNITANKDNTNNFLIWSTAAGSSNISDGAFSGKGSGIKSTNGVDGMFFQFSLDASQSSNLYGNSETIQPPAIVLIPQVRY